MMRIFDNEEAEIVMFLRTLFEERKDLEKMIIDLRKEVNARDLVLQKYSKNYDRSPTYLDLISDTLASYYDNPVFQRYYTYLKEFCK